MNTPHQDHDAPRPAPPPRVGRYDLLSLLGSGGTARVYKAVQRGPDGFRRPVALKVLEPGSEGSSGEAWLSARASHPNLVTLLDYGRASGREYLAMELVEGPTLAAQLLRAGPPAPAVAVRIGLDLCEAITHLHGLSFEGRPVGLIHRDIKPSNVLLGAEGQVKLTDLGIAKATALAGEHTATGITKGTPAYMSPEQLRAEPLDSRSDLFSLGLLLAEVLTGWRLFRGRTSAELMIGIAAVGARLEDPRFPAGLEEVLPGSRALVRRCLQPAPSDRPASAEEVARGLRELVEPADRSAVAEWISLRGGAVPVRRPIPETVPLRTPSLPDVAIHPLTTRAGAPAPRISVQGPSGGRRLALPLVVAALAVFALGAFVGSTALVKNHPPHEPSSVLHHERGEVVVEIGRPALVTAHGRPADVRELRVLYRLPNEAWTSASMRAVSEAGDWAASIDTGGAEEGALSYYFRGASPRGGAVTLGGSEHPWAIRLTAPAEESPSGP